MDSNLLASIHIWSVMLFVVIYLVKTVLLFANQSLLDRFTRITKVPEMIVSTVFLISGIWLFVMVGGVKNLQIIKLVMVFAAIPLAVMGFKRKKKSVALLSFLLIIAAYGLAEMAKKKPYIERSVVITMDDGSDLTHGKRIYFANCVFCHGENGDKMYRGANNLKDCQLSTDMIGQLVREGVKARMPMPSYAHLSDKDVAAVALYVANLKNVSAVPAE
jgi:mono/diheme cytochrome c family protein